MPPGLIGLADYGLIQEVIRPLMSGKEAQIYLVLSEGEVRVAKVYREAEHRDFKHRTAYTEGRTIRNSRDRRAMAKRSNYGRSQDEAAWRSAEVDMIYRLSDAGVRVPTPHHFIDGVLIMELVKDADGEPAPRLGDLNLDADTAALVYEQLLREVIRMLCAGVVHGDLSDFNVLMDSNGPVIIDFPQSIDASRNTGARRLLLRDVDNLHNFARRFMPKLRPKPYAQEMWELYQRGELTADTELRGQFKASDRRADTDDVLGLIREADEDEQRRRQGAGPAPRGRRREVIITSPQAHGRGDSGGGRGRGSQDGQVGQVGRNGQASAGNASRDGGGNRGGRGRRGGRSSRRGPLDGAGQHPQAQQAANRTGTDANQGGDDRDRSTRTNPAQPPHGGGAQSAEGQAPRKRRRRRRGGGGSSGHNGGDGQRVGDIAGTGHGGKPPPEPTQPRRGAPARAQRSGDTAAPQPQRSAGTRGPQGPQSQRGQQSPQGPQSQRGQQGPQGPQAGGQGKDATEGQAPRRRRRRRRGPPRGDTGSGPTGTGGGGTREP